MLFRWSTYVWYMAVIPYTYIIDILYYKGLVEPLEPAAALRIVQDRRIKTKIINTLLAIKIQDPR